MDRVNNLQKLGKRSITASDISAQYWCEKQMELNAMFGSKKTYAMQKGTNVHAQMQEKVYVELKAQPLNYADRLYKEAYDNCLNLSKLKSEGRCREIKIYGSINGYTIVGKVDELRLVNGMILVVEDKTTHGSEEISEAKMRTNKVQIMLYRRLIGDIVGKEYTYQNFASAYKIEGMQMSDAFRESVLAQEIGREAADLKSIWSEFFEMLSSFGEVGDDLEIDYRDRNSGEIHSKAQLVYGKERFDKEMMHVMKYWNGEREAMPVVEEEKWKCRICPFFGKQCTVWLNRL